MSSRYADFLALPAGSDAVRSRVMATGRRSEKLAELVRRIGEGDGALAAEHPDPATAALLELGGAVVPDTHGETALHLASRFPSAGIVNAILRHNASPNVRAESGQSPLHCAATAGHASVLRSLLAADADPNVTDVLGRTAMHLAARQGDVRAIEALQTAGAATDARDTLGRTSLHLAAEQGHAAALACLLRIGADPLAADTKGQTALHGAASALHGAAVEALLDHAAAADDRAGLAVGGAPDTGRGHSGKPSDGGAPAGSLVRQVLNHVDTFGRTPLAVVCGAAERGAAAARSLAALIRAGATFDYSHVRHALHRTRGDEAPEDAVAAAAEGKSVYDTTVVDLLLAAGGDLLLGDAMADPVAYSQKYTPPLLATPGMPGLPTYTTDPQENDTEMQKHSSLVLELRGWWSLPGQPATGRALPTSARAVADSVHTEALHRFRVEEGHVFHPVSAVAAAVADQAAGPVPTRIPGGTGRTGASIPRLEVLCRAAVRRGVGLAGITAFGDFGLPCSVLSALMFDVPEGHALVRCSGPSRCSGKDGSGSDA